jgi:hypothetical protein|nr:hypothetical protein [Kofleriaceae bacterium]
MWKILASLAVVVACAHHEPVAAPPPVATATSSPAALFEIDTNDLAGGPQKSILYSDGTWRLDAAGGRTTTGRISADDLAKAQRDAASPWQASERTGIRCHMAHAPTNYLANGALVFADVGCSSKVLDAASAAALAELEQILPK